MPVLRKDVPGHQYLRAREFSGFNPAADSHRVIRIRTQIPHGGEASACQRLSHGRFEFVGWSGRRVLPAGLEVHVAVPEAGHDHFVLASNLFRRYREIELVPAGRDGADFAVLNQYNGASIGGPVGDG
jgi:hypothetical protein